MPTQRGCFSETVTALVDGARAEIGRQPEPGLGAHDSTPHQESLVRFVILDHLILPTTFGHAERNSTTMTMSLLVPGRIRASCCAVCILLRKAHDHVVWY